MFNTSKHLETLNWLSIENTLNSFGYTVIQQTLAPIANRWYEQMHKATVFPIQHDEFIARCHTAGPIRPTPLLLQYVTENFNCLHQDKDEAGLSAPIVSVSLGLPDTFLLGGLMRHDSTQCLTLSHGDIIVLGGSSRLRYHAILPIKAGVHLKTGACRINLTFRRAKH